MVPGTLITFTPIIKHLITTTANKDPGKKSFIDLKKKKKKKNPTVITRMISVLRL